jgi:hypothetical protein
MGEKKITQEHIAVKMSENFVNIVYRLPIKMIFGSKEKLKAHDEKQGPSQNGKKVNKSETKKDK